MRICVSDGKGFRLDLPLPTGLVLNRLTAGVACRAAEEQGIQVSPRQMKALFDSIHAYRKNHPDWVLVEVRGADGEQVLIKL